MVGCGLGAGGRGARAVRLVIALWGFHFPLLPPPVPPPVSVLVLVSFLCGRDDGCAGRTLWTVRSVLLYSFSFFLFFIFFSARFLNLSRSPQVSYCLLSVFRFLGFSGFRASTLDSRLARCGYAHRLFRFVSFRSVSLVLLVWWYGMVVVWWWFGVHRSHRSSTLLHPAWSSLTVHIIYLSPYRPIAFPARRPPLFPPSSLASHASHVSHASPAPP